MRFVSWSSKIGQCRRDFVLLSQSTSHLCVICPQSHRGRHLGTTQEAKLWTSARLWQTRCDSFRKMAELFNCRGCTISNPPYSCVLLLQCCGVLWPSMLEPKFQCPALSGHEHPALSWSVTSFFVTGPAAVLTRSKLNWRDRLYLDHLCLPFNPLRIHCLLAFPCSLILVWKICRRFHQQSDFR